MVVKTVVTTLRVDPKLLKKATTLLEKAGKTGPVPTKGKFLSYCLAVGLAEVEKDYRKIGVIR